MSKQHAFTLILAISTETFAAQCDPKKEKLLQLCHQDQGLILKHMCRQHAA